MILTIALINVVFFYDWSSQEQNPLGFLNDTVKMFIITARIDIIVYEFHADTEEPYKDSLLHPSLLYLLHIRMATVQGPAVKTGWKWTNSTCVNIIYSAYDHSLYDVDHLVCDITWLRFNFKIAGTNSANQDTKNWTQYLLQLLMGLPFALASLKSRLTNTGLVPLNFCF